MKLVLLPCAIRHHNGMEKEILEVVQTQYAGHFGVEALIAKLSVTLLNRAIVHDLVGSDGNAARVADDLAVALLTVAGQVDLQMLRFDKISFSLR